MHKNWLSIVFNTQFDSSALLPNGPATAQARVAHMGVLPSDKMLSAGRWAVFSWQHTATAGRDSLGYK